MSDELQFVVPSFSGTSDKLKFVGQFLNRRLVNLAFEAMDSSLICV